jgi:hypothetical protein
MQPAASMSLETGKSYAQLVNVPSSTCSGKTRVKPAAVAESYIINKLTGVGICNGSMMPKVGGPLPAAQIDTIRRWICQGAPNN